MPPEEGADSSSGAPHVARSRTGVSLPIFRLGGPDNPPAAASGTRTPGVPQRGGPWALPRGSLPRRSRLALTARWPVASSPTVVSSSPPWVRGIGRLRRRRVRRRRWLPGRAGVVVVSVAVAVARPRAGRRGRRRWRRCRRRRRRRWRRGRWHRRGRRRRGRRRRGRWWLVMRRSRGRSGARGGLSRDPRNRRGRGRSLRCGGWCHGRKNRPARSLRESRRVNDHPSQARNRRSAEDACRPRAARRLREKAGDQPAAGDRDCEQERRDHALHPHAFPFPTSLGIRLPVLLPQLGSEVISTLPTRARPRQSLVRVVLRPSRFAARAS